MKRFLLFFLFTATVFAQSSKDKIQGSGTQPETMPFQISAPVSSAITSSAFAIFNGNTELMVSIGIDGKITYGPNYKPDEAAKIFWETVGSYAPQAPTPKPEWVPDPAAGHYDCPDGWTAFARSEPEKPWDGPVAASAVYIEPWDGPVAASAVYIEPHKDKKGHVLGEQPAPPVCIRDSK